MQIINSGFNFLVKSTIWFQSLVPDAKPVPADELQLSVEEEEGQLMDDDDEEDVVQFMVKEEEKQLELDRLKEEKQKDKEKEEEERRKKRLERQERFEKKKQEEASANAVAKIGEYSDTHGNGEIAKSTSLFSVVLASTASFVENLFVV